MKQAVLVLVFVLSGLWFKQPSAKVVLQSAAQLPVDRVYDSLVDPSMERLLTRFKHNMDQTVSRRIGTVAKQMKAGRPESPLSNFLTDQLLEKARTLTVKKVDMAVLNVGGIRATMDKGALTVEDLYRVVPFEDEVVLLTLKGKDLMLLFQYMARTGGEGLSGARLTFSGGKVFQATVNDEPIDENKSYILATVDYLAQGNGGFSVFLRATEVFRTRRKARDCFLEQIEKLTAEGKTIQGGTDGRITILP